MSPPATPSSSLKREFLKKWLMGLQICKPWNKNNDMSVLARKKAIKLSADLAIASARRGTTCWSRALICDASNESSSGKHLVRQMLGSDKSAPTSARRTGNYVSSTVRMRKMSGIRRSLRRARSGRGRCISGCARSVTKSLVRKRTEVLKRLVPGGRFMDGIGLIEETLDYIVALHAQVDVMRRLAGVSEIGN